MPRGGKRVGSGRKALGTRKAVLVRLDRELEESINQLRNGKSLTNTVERLLRAAVKDIKDDDETANSALGFIVGQAASAANWKDRTWRNDPATTEALKRALPLIVDLLAPADGAESKPVSHPMFKSTDEHARMILFWILKRLRERGDEYGTDWPAGHPLRNFPRAAAALDFKFTNDGDHK